MATEDTLIWAGVALIAGYAVYSKIFNTTPVTRQEAFTLTQKAAEARGVDSWFAPMQNKQAIISGDPATENTTTYFLDENDYNVMSPIQKLLFSKNYSLKSIFG